MWVGERASVKPLKEAYKPKPEIMLKYSRNNMLFRIGWRLRGSQSLRVGPN